MTADVIIDSPDAELLPDPETSMFEFYEGLDTNLFSESTGINHNASPKWLKAELARHLDFLSYLLSVKSNKAIMSDAIVHTNALLDNSVTANKLSPELRGILESGDLYNVIERNSVQTLNCISATGTDSILHVAAGTVISQANGFGTLGQIDKVETISVSASIVQTLGETLTGYLYKVVGGAYVQSTTPLATLGSNMVGTRVLLGTFKVSASPDNFVYDVVSATPLATFRDVAFTGTVVLPSTTSIGTITNTELSYIDGVTSSIQTQFTGKQATLVSGTNIKTINSTSLLGSGDISTPIASTEEAQVGKENTKAITPLRLREGLNATGTAPIYACRAWVNFNGTGAVAIRASGNVSSITDNGVGDYTVNFTTAMPDVNYSKCVTNSSIAGGGVFSMSDSYGITSSPPTVSSFRMCVSSYNSTLNDALYINASVFR